MPIVRMPDNQLVRFPDEMPGEEIGAFITKHFPEPDDDSFGISDVGNALQVGYGSAAQGVGWAAEKMGMDDDNSIRDYWNNYTKEQTSQYSGRAQEARTKDMSFDDVGGALIKIATVGAESLPGMVMSAPIGAGVASALTKTATMLYAAGKGGAGVAYAAGAASPLTFAGRVAAKSPAVVGASVGEGVSAGLTSSAGIKSQTLDTPVEQLRDTPGFVAIHSQLANITDPNERDRTAHTMLADAMANYTFAPTLAATSVLGAVAGGGVMGQVIGRNAAKKAGNVVADGVVKRTLSGAKEEARQEFLQSGSDKLIENLRTQEFIDPNQETWQGVPRAAIEGGIIGGAIGGVVGAADINTQPKKSAAPPTNPLDTSTITDPTKSVGESIDAFVASVDQDLILGQQSPLDIQTPVNPTQELAQPTQTPQASLPPTQPIQEAQNGTDNLPVGTGLLSTPRPAIGGDNLQAGDGTTILQPDSGSNAGADGSAATPLSGAGQNQPVTSSGNAAVAGGLDIAGNDPKAAAWDAPNLLDANGNPVSLKSRQVAAKDHGISLTAATFIASEQAKGNSPTMQEAIDHSVAEAKRKADEIAQQKKDIADGTSLRQSAEVATKEQKDRSDYIKNLGVKLEDGIYRYEGSDEDSVKIEKGIIYTQNKDGEWIPKHSAKIGAEDSGAVSTAIYIAKGAEAYLPDGSKVLEKLVKQQTAPATPIPAATGEATTTGTIQKLSSGDYVATGFTRDQLIKAGIDERSIDPKGQGRFPAKTNKIQLERALGISKLPEGTVLAEGDRPFAKRKQANQVRATTKGLSKTHHVIEIEGGYGIAPKVTVPTAAPPVSETENQKPDDRRTNSAERKHVNEMSPEEKDAAIAEMRATHDSAQSKNKERMAKAMAEIEADIGTIEDNLTQTEQDALDALMSEARQLIGHDLYDRILDSHKDEGVRSRYEALTSLLSDSIGSIRSQHERIGKTEQTATGVAEEGDKTGSTEAGAGASQEAKVTPEFESVHPKSQEKFNAAWDAKDVASMQEYLDPANKGLRAEFESRAKVKLPKTISGTDKVVADYFGEVDKAEQPASQFANNKIFTQSAVDEARAILKKKLGTLNSGIDPELLQAGMTVAGAHIESGARSFAAYSKAMIDDLGDAIKPYLRSLYESVRHYPGLNTDGMTGSADIDAIAAVQDKIEPEVKANRAEGTHFAAGKADFNLGKPRVLPSYFADKFGKNAKDWYRGWDVANVAAPIVNNSGDTFIGKNTDGASIWADKRGVRYYFSTGIKIQEAVGIIPGGGIEIRNRKDEYKTAEELGIDKQGEVAQDNQQGVTKNASPSQDNDVPGADTQTNPRGRAGGRGTGESLDTGLAGQSEGSDNGERVSGSVRVPSEPGARPTGDAEGIQPPSKTRADGTVRPASGTTDTELDHAITDADEIGSGGLVAKFRDNVAAIKILKSLDPDNRAATPEERKTLARYVGFGALKGVFDKNNKQWAKQYTELRELLNDEEYDSARASVLNAHYTSKPVVDSMFAAVKRMGFAGGRFLEPSVGSGNFFGMMPSAMSKASQLYGVELDLLTSKLVKAIYPKANIAVATGFQHYQVPSGYFDIAMGNPPFGSEPIIDRERSEYSGFSIHNYFIARMIDKVRDGGIVPVIVSHNFMDAINPKTREWIAKRANLIAAVRLPNTAFKGNAGTEVVTDILFFQKTATPEKSPAWVDASDVVVPAPKGGESATASVNVYFQRNKQNILGKETTAGSMYRANEYTVEPTGNLTKQLAEFVETLPDNIYKPLERTINELDSADNTIPAGVKQGSYFINDKGEVKQRGQDIAGTQTSTAWTPKNDTAMARMKGMISLRNQLRSQMRMERDPVFGVKMIESHRTALSKSYDEFFKKYGYVNSQVNSNIFMDDTEYALLQAIEFDYDKGVSKATALRNDLEERAPSAKKADILARRVLFPFAEQMNVTSANDALLSSLDAKGKVDLEYMERAYGKSQKEIISELGDMLYLDPATGDHVMSDEYLSGDVKTKLAVAKRSADENHEYARNVTALEKVIPHDKMPSEIYASLGAGWISSVTFKQFATEITGSSNIDLTYLAATAQWLGHINDGGDVGKMSSDFGTKDLTSFDLLKLTMNGKAPEVKKRIMRAGDEVLVTDVEATEAAREKVNKIKQAWESWVWNDGSRAEKLAGIFNEKHNRTVNREYDGDHLILHGSNPAIVLRKHQKSAVWRGIQDRNLLLDHAVGAGKTFVGAAIIMEYKRLGISRKPILVVPNHLTTQWRSEFARMYPAANVLAANPDDFSKANRQRMFSKIALGEYDAVIIGHSSLTKIGLDPAIEEGIYKEQIDEIADAIEAMKLERGDRGIVRDMEKIKANLEAKVEKLRALAGEKDKVVTFDELGIDGMFIDEMHEFKNLFFVTQMNRVSGLGNPKGSGKAFDLFAKVRWLTKTYGEKVPFITATGTPVSNSLSEMFTMQRYMKYDEMKRDGLHLFDSWARMYGDVESLYEVAPSGVGYRISQRFSKFKNLPSLMAHYRTFADTVTLQDLKDQAKEEGKTFPVPKIATGKPENIVAQRSNAQRDFFGVPVVRKDESGNTVFAMNYTTAKVEQNNDAKWILSDGHTSSSFDTKEDAELALVEKSLTPILDLDPESLLGQFGNLAQLTRETKGKINALSLTSLASKAGLDMRIINPHAEDFAGSKINKAVDRMMDVYQKWGKDKGAQLVFCDTSIPLSARASMATKDRRLFVLDEQGLLTHKKGTLHTVEGFEGFPFYLVRAADRGSQSIHVYDPVSGARIKGDTANKADAKAWVAEFLSKDSNRDKWYEARSFKEQITAERMAEYRSENDLELAEDGSNEVSMEDIEGVAGASQFSVYDDIKAKLVDRGVPENQIAFIHDYDTPAKKQALFKSVNRGDIRFLFGSTPKLGAGTNVQERLVGLHHIDAPWRPSDLEQREGRIIRQGNVLYARDPGGFEVFIGRYATEQTYDTRRWQLLEHKASGIEQLRKYSGQIEIEDVAGEASNSADMKAAASGNPLILEETKLRTEVKRLTSLQKAHGDGKYSLQRRLSHERNRVSQWLPARIQAIDAEIAEAKATLPTMEKGKVPTMVIDGKTITDKEKAEKKIAEAVTLVRTGFAKSKDIYYRGVKFTIVAGFNGALAVDTTIGTITSYGEKDGVSPSGMITRFANYIDSLDQRKEHAQTELEQAKKDIASIEARMDAPFDDIAALASAQQSHSIVQRKLMKSSQIDAVPPEDRAAFNAEITERKKALKDLGYGTALNEMNSESIADGQVKQSAMPGMEQPPRQGTALFSFDEGGDYAAINDPSPEETQFVQDGIEGKSVVEAAEFVAKNATEASHRLIAERVAIRLKQLESVGSIFTMNVSHVDGEIPSTMLQAGIRGQVIQKPNDPVTHIWVNGADVTGVVGTSYETVLHELVHAATQKAIDLGQHGATGEIGNATKDLFDVLSHVKKGIQEKIDNGISLNDFEMQFNNKRNNSLANVHELVSWTLTNKATQEYMESIPYKKTTLWGEFVSVVRRLIGLDASNETALSEILRITDKFMSIDAHNLWVESMSQGVYMSINYARTDKNGRGRAIVNSAVQANIPGTAAQPAQPPRQGNIGLTGGEARKTPRFNLPEETSGQTFVRVQQNKLNRIKIVQDAVREQNGIVEVSEDVYQAMERMPSKVAVKQKHFTLTTVAEQTKRMADLDVTLEELGTYLMALGAEDRNAYIQTKRSDMPNNGSGWSNEEAQEVIADYKKRPNFTEIDKLARDIQKVTDAKLNVMVAGKVITQGQADEMKSAMGFYVPYKGFEIIDDAGSKVGSGIGGGYSTSKRISKQAFGRLSKAGQVVENIYRDYHAALYLVEKAHVGEYMTNLVVKNPDQSLWSIGLPEKQAIAGKDGQVQYRDMGFDNEKEIRYIRNGQEFRIQIHDPLFLAAYNNLNAEQFGAIAEIASNFNSFLRQMYVQKNPNFLARNTLRDAQTAFVSYTGEEGATQAAKMMTLAPSAAKAAFSMVRDLKTGTEWDAYIDLANKYGALNSFAMLDDLETQQLKLEETIAKHGSNGIVQSWKRGISVWKSGMAVKGSPLTKYGKAVTKTGQYLVYRALDNAVFNTLEALNGASENAFRLAAFRTYIESHGGLKNVTPKVLSEASRISKNLTVNFSRSGQMSTKLNAFYLFWKASVNGTANVHRILTDTPHKRQAQAICAGLFSLGVAMAMLTGDEDDELSSEYDKEHNLLIHGDGTTWKLILAYGFGFFYGAGYTTGNMLKGRVTPIKAAVSMTGLFFQHFTPTGSPVIKGEFDAKAVALMASPTLLDPLTTIATNQTSFGNKLVPHYSDDDGKLDRETMYRGTRGTPYDKAANSTMLAWADISPETLKFIGNTLTGGAGGFVSDMAKTAGSVFTHGKEVEVERIPLAAVAFNTKDVEEYRSRFYTQMDDVKKIASGSDKKQSQILGTSVVYWQKRMKGLREREQKARENGNWKSVYAIEKDQIDLSKRMNTRYHKAMDRINP